MCSTTSIAAGISTGRPATIICRHSSAPADPPMTMTFSKAVDLGGWMQKYGQRGRRQPQDPILRLQILLAGGDGWGISCLLHIAVCACIWGVTRTQLLKGRNAEAQESSKAPVERYRRRSRGGERSCQDAEVDQRTQ